MTLRAFAVREGVKYHTFAHWLREVRIKSGEHVVRPRRARFIEFGRPVVSRLGEFPPTEAERKENQCRQF